MTNRLTSMVLAACCLGWSAIAVAQPPAQEIPLVAAPMPNPGVKEGLPLPPVVPLFNPRPSLMPDDGESAPPIVSVGFEYLLRWVSEQRPMPLVTRGPSSDLVPAALGQPGTQVLLNNFDTERVHHGGRLTLALGLESGADCAVQASGFWLGRAQSEHRYSSEGEAGSAVLARPFFNAVAGVQDAT